MSNPYEMGKNGLHPARPTPRLRFVCTIEFHDGRVKYETWTALRPKVVRMSILAKYGDAVKSIQVGRGF